MLTGLITNVNINFFLVFLEGLLSFFSPCVIPLIPIYMGYLAGNAKRTEADGSISYEQKKVFFHTVFFVIGISAAFFILGISFTALGSFFKENRLLFTRIGGILIILLGLVQVGFLEFHFLKREHKFHLNINDRKMGPVLAFLMGFTFSFAWTPCIGPALSSVLIMASSGQSSFAGNLLVFVYTAGFIIPFLLLGLFTAKVLNFLKKQQKLLKYTVKAGGILLILIGFITFTGWMNGISGYLNRFSPQKLQNNNGITLATPTPSPTITATPTTEPGDSDTEVGPTSGGADNAAGSSGNPSEEKHPAYDFTLTDQYGKEHTLSDYKGKVVFLNFWATWCPPCNGELPDIEALYNDYGKNEKDVIILGVTNPKSDAYPDNADVSKDDVLTFLKDKKYTFPVLFDETGDILSNYYISAFPTTFLIDKDGNIFGYAPGALTKDMMINAINQTIASTD